MKNWSGVYNKYKDSELMKEFREYFIDKRRSKRIFAYLDIKDIFGYLICFAETKGYNLCIIVGRRIAKSITMDKMNLEQAMLWCTNKFFEINEKVENEQK